MFQRQQKQTASEGEEKNGKREQWTEPERERGRKTERKKLRARERDGVEKGKRRSPDIRALRQPVNICH